MSIEAMKRIKSLLQDTKTIDSHTISAVVAECDMAILAKQPDQSVNEKHFGDFELLVVTTAYEQGFGHAFRTELSNPYAPATNAYKAWDMGRSAGKRNGQPQQPATGVPVTQWQKRHPIRTAGRWISTDEHDAKRWSKYSRGWEVRPLYDRPAPSVQAMDNLDAVMTEKLDSTRTALVNPKTYWVPITDKTPRGVKCFLANRSAKSATTGTVATEEKFFTHYFPMPVFDPSEE